MLSDLLVGENVRESSFNVVRWVQVRSFAFLNKGNQQRVRRAKSGGGS